MVTRYKGRLSINKNSGGTLEIAEFLERMKRASRFYNKKKKRQVKNTGRVKRSKRT